MRRAGARSRMAGRTSWEVLACCDRANRGLCGDPLRRADWACTVKRSGAPKRSEGRRKGDCFASRCKAGLHLRHASFGWARPAAENSCMKSLRGRAACRLLIAL
jgi:hypothetical protein